MTMIAVRGDLKVAVVLMAVAIVIWLGYGGTSHTLNMTCNLQEP